MKVGDYVRTKNGEIFKKPLYSTSDIIVKSSPNIIDLIEEDDFINGMRITQIISNKNGVLECMKDSDYEFITTITNNEVKSVLTHEQFENWEYRIDD